MMEVVGWNFVDAFQYVKVLWMSFESGVLHYFMASNHVQERHNLVCFSFQSPLFEGDFGSRGGVRLYPVDGTGFHLT